MLEKISFFLQLLFLTNPLVSVPIQTIIICLTDSPLRNNLVLFSKTSFFNQICFLTKIFGLNINVFFWYKLWCPSTVAMSSFIPVQSTCHQWQSKPKSRNRERAEIKSLFHLIFDSGPILCSSCFSPLRNHFKKSGFSLTLVWQSTSCLNLRTGIAYYDFVWRIFTNIVLKKTMYAISLADVLQKWNNSKLPNFDVLQNHKKYSDHIWLYYTLNPD